MDVAQSSLLFLFLTVCDGAGTYVVDGIKDLARSEGIGKGVDQGLRSCDEMILLDRQIGQNAMETAIEFERVRVCYINDAPGAVDDLLLGPNGLRRDINRDRAGVSHAPPVFLVPLAFFHYDWLRPSGCPRLSQRKGRSDTPSRETSH